MVQRAYAVGVLILPLPLASYLILENLNSLGGNFLNRMK